VNSKHKPPILTQGMAFVLISFYELGLGWLFLPLGGAELEGHFMTFFVRISGFKWRWSKREGWRFKTLIETGIHPIECNPGHIGQERRNNRAVVSSDQTQKMRFKKVVWLAWNGLLQVVNLRVLSNEWLYLCPVTLRKLSPCPVLLQIPEQW